MSIRLEKDKLGNDNLEKLLELIDKATIKAIFDPYLDNKALDNLINLKSIGASISLNLRLLTSKKNRLKKSHIDLFSQSLAGSNDFRCVTSGNPHRRFILLNNGCSLILGCSLNDISKVK